MDFKKSVPPKLLQKLEKSGISTLKQILTISDSDLKVQTNLNEDDVSLLKNVAATFIMNSESSLNTYKVYPSQYISTGCNILNQSLHGGFRCGTITEIYGESGSGKTQLCINATTHNWSKGIAYICTEGLFPVKRLHQIQKHLPNYQHTMDYGKNTFVEHVTEVEELMSCVCVRLPKLLIKHKLGLIIIDSIAAPFRCDKLNYVERAREIREVAIALIKLAKKYNLAIVCVNQVTTSFNKSNENVLPTLGLAWSNMVGTRLFVQKTQRYIKIQDVHKIQPPVFNKACKDFIEIRKFSIVFSPDLPNSSSNFVVQSSGVRSIILKL